MSECLQSSEQKMQSEEKKNGPLGEPITPVQELVTCCFQLPVFNAAYAEEIGVKTYPSERKALVAEIKKSTKDWKATLIYKEFLKILPGSGAKISWWRCPLEYSFKSSEAEGGSSASSGGGYHHFILLNKEIIIHFKNCGSSIYTSGEVVIEAYTTHIDKSTGKVVDKMLDEKAYEDFHMENIIAVLGVVNYSLLKNNCESVATFIYVGQYISFQVVETALIQKAISNGKKEDYMVYLGVTPPCVRNSRSGYKRDFIHQLTGDKENIVIIDASSSDPESPMLESMLNLRSGDSLKIFDPNHRSSEIGFVTINDVNHILTPQNKPGSPYSRKVMNDAFDFAVKSRVNSVRGVVLFTDCWDFNNEASEAFNKQLNIKLPFIVMIKLGHNQCYMKWTEHAERENMRGGRPYWVEYFNTNDDNGIQYSDWSTIIARSKMLKEVSMPAIDIFKI